MPAGGVGLCLVKIVHQRPLVAEICYKYSISSLIIIAKLAEIGKLVKKHSGYLSPVWTNRLSVVREVLISHKIRDKNSGT